MPDWIFTIAAVTLIIHGIIHLMGFIVYWNKRDLEGGMKYKTTLLNGRWDLEDRSMKWFGVLWLLSMIGFIVTGVGLATEQPWWQFLLVPVTILSLVVCVLDWGYAYAGAALDIVILILLVLLPFIT